MGSAAARGGEDEAAAGATPATAAADELPPPIAHFRNYAPRTPDLQRGIVVRGPAPYDALVAELKEEDKAAFALSDVRARARAARRGGGSARAPRPVLPPRALTEGWRRTSR